MPRKKKAEEVQEVEAVATEDEVIELQEEDVAVEDTTCYTFITNVTILQAEGNIHYQKGSRIRLTDEEAKAFKGKIIKTKTKDEKDCGC